MLRMGCWWLRAMWKPSPPRWSVCSQTLACASDWLFAPGKLSSNDSTSKTTLRSSETCWRRLFRPRTPQRSPARKRFWCLSGSLVMSRSRKIGYVLKRFPRLSETFILNELLELERLATPLQIYSLSDVTAEETGSPRHHL